MKNLLLLLICSLFCLHLSQAQKEFTISMKKQKLTESLSNRYIDKVYLVQPEDSCLGVITKGLVKTTTPVYFEKNIKDELTDFLISSMPDKEGYTPLILRINRLYLYSIRKYDNLYICLELSITFITRKDSLFYEEFSAGEAPSRLLFEPGLTIPWLVRDAFDLCFSQYNERLQKGLIVPIVMNEKQIKENPLGQPDHFRCFANRTRIKGIYRKYYDFRDNVVDTAFHFTIQHNYDEDHPEMTRTWLKYKGKSPPDDIWGFSDGDGDFIKVGKSFCRLTNDSNIFFAYTHSKEYSEDITSSAVFGGLLFGVVGAALFGGLTAANAGDKYIIKTKVDLFYGKLIPVESADYTKISSTLVFYFSKLSEPGITMSLYENDILRCTMTPDTYLTLEFSCRHPEAKLKLVASNGISLQEDVQLNLMKTAVFLVKVKNKETLVFNQLHDQMKRDMLNSRSKAKNKPEIDIR